MIRDYNITKKEWVLDGDTVIYGSALDLKETLDYDFSQERSFSYKGLSMDGIIHHIAIFVANLWQIHVFGEGNTRTTAVFLIKYLRTLGFSATNDSFANNAWYFRNALVRANYTNLKKGIHETTEYLELFLRNLLLGEHHPLHSRVMHISGQWAKVDIDGEKVDIGSSKVDIESQKVDIQTGKQILEELLAKSGEDFSAKTNIHIHRMFAEYGTTEIFGRASVSQLLDLKPAAASKLMARLRDAGIIVPVPGQGKGKYRFSKA